MKTTDRNCKGRWPGGARPSRWRRWAHQFQFAHRSFITVRVNKPLTQHGRSQFLAFLQAAIAEKSRPKVPRSRSGKIIYLW